MNFFEATKSGFKNYVVFNKRASRSEFWYFNLAITLMSAFIIWIEISYGPADIKTYLEQSNGGPFLNIFSIVTILPTLSISVRRLHDRGHSGWNLLWSITIIGLIPLIIIFMLPPKDEDNKWGRNPLLN